MHNLALAEIITGYLALTMIRFKEFQIKGLFGRSFVQIPIVKNRIVIVGYNGVGKSTILNAFYYLISCQWSKLDEILFEEIVLVTTKRTIRVTKSEVSSHRRRRQPNHRIPQRYIDEVLENLSGDELRLFLTEPIRSRSDFGQLAILRQLPMQIIRDLQVTVRDIIGYSGEIGSHKSNIMEIQAYFAEELKGRILYLPTYRRIEKDIKTIFPEIEEEIQDAIRQRTRGSKSAKVFVELVNFGMEDVKSKINERLERLRAQALAEVNSLATRYLRDVIRNEASTYRNDLSKKIEQESLDTVFRRADDSILSIDDRRGIDTVVKKIKDRRTLDNNEQYVAHYVAYLIETAERIKEYEKPVRDFVDICNSYLYGKKFVFDNVEYRFSIEYSSDKMGLKESESLNNKIQMEDLSSGEKQIVSLFSHLVLDEEVNYIIIDEPELSLSVDWQQRFLADIVNTKGCAFLGAVTHSPFIFDNELDRHAIDILKHMN